MSLVTPVSGLEKVLLGAGLGLLLLAAIGASILVFAKMNEIILVQSAKRALKDVACPGVATDDRGRILAVTPSAQRMQGFYPGGDLFKALSDMFGLPIRSAERLLALSITEGVANETVNTGRRKLRLDAQRFSTDRLIWTFEQRTGFSTEADAADRVAILSIAPDGRIAGGNAKASELLGEIPQTAAKLFGDKMPEQAATCELQVEDAARTFTVIELRDVEGWRDIALIPARFPTQSSHGEILSKPGLLEALPVPMLKLSADGDLIEANREARTILSLENSVLPQLYELVEGMGRSITDWLSDAVQGRGLLKPEIVRAVRPGQELFLQITLGRTIENGEVVLVGILNDATELKTLEAQFVQSQKMQAIGQLAGGVAHDFNNLLTAISGHCDLLLLRHDPGDPDYADLIQISQNSNRAASLVGQLLAFSRKQNLKPQALDLRDTMTDLAHLLNRLIGERIQLNVVHAPGAQIIRADRRQLEQVIVNLVVNARDAMPEGGRISITIRRNDLHEELVRDRAHVPPGQYVLIEVADTGVGIPADGITKIFEPFYTTKKTGEGTGLGLSTAYGIVKQTGGYIFVDSTVNEGTLFSLYFPVGEAIEPPKAEPREPDTTPQSGCTGGVILLVEDEAPVRAFASRALRMRGYTVLEAENAEEALRILDDQKLTVDLFVTDVIMPGLDGPTWVLRALESRPGTPTVFVSGYSEEGRVEQQARIPNSVFLPKPFSLHQLTAIVNEQVC